MKKLLAIVLAVAIPLIALVAVAVPLVSANAGPHGNYSAITDACAGCHRAHTAPARPLLVEDEPALCLSCHGAAATAANTNVEDGLYSNRSGVAGLGNYGDPLHGGGFVRWQSYYSDTATLVTTTSKHAGAFTGGNTAVGSWGLLTTTGSITGTAGVQGASINGGFACSSCHNPHGNTNWRMLNTNINGMTVTVMASSGISGSPPITSPVSAPYTGLNHNYGSGIASFCEACHPAYHSTRYDDVLNKHAGERESTRATTQATYATMQFTGYQGYGDTRPYPLPPADTNGDGNVRGLTCLTCHTAHGTSASMTGFAALVPNSPQGLSYPGHSPTGDSALLRLPNRGVCEVCHRK
jgi:predicted CXXCH cytochrome family protein